MENHGEVKRTDGVASAVTSKANIVFGKFGWNTISYFNKPFVPGG